MKNTDLSLCLTSELRLEQAIKEAGVDNLASVNKLTVSGLLTKDDLWHIRKNMAETLKELDMSGAVIEENTIKTWAFKSCTGLTSIHIPEGVVNINEEAFKGCAGLISVIIPDSVTAIDSETF